MKKYVVDDRNGNLIGMFKTIKDARAYIEKDAAHTKNEYEFQNKDMPQPTIIEDGWSPFFGVNEYTLDIYDNFEYTRHTFVWTVREIFKSEFTF